MSKKQVEAMRQDGFYWADVVGTREVCEWKGGNWYLCGICFSDGIECAEHVKNINENRIKE